MTEDHTSVTGRHPALSSAWDASRHLGNQNWPSSMGLSNNLSSWLIAILRVWSVNERTHRYPGDLAAQYVSEVNTVAALTLLHDLVRRKIDQLELEIIEQARKQGITWDDLAPALKMGSRNSAQRYYRLLEKQVQRTPDT